MVAMTPLMPWRRFFKDFRGVFSIFIEFFDLDQFGGENF